MITPVERISIFDIFKIGVGPSSSHTMGPWKAASEFCRQLVKNDILKDVLSISINLFGSLAKTGKGHGTDMAIILGLIGEKADTVDPLEIGPKVQRVKNEKKIRLLEQHEIPL
jgi:L-serine dehydratase